ncbi:hypothetical protein [Amycolatopsis magusensis]|uniref:Uncharacterized protein n=1 Tax=Amycolatopsis magusensis TaxID=882444 RepID=A0ABS4Q1J9_9PSEU|nr:hypothetical protein [Amycolatopsis magusensis]MBP2185550.1 hypothetical protein [Amycolatopsis magusensis]
MSLSAARPVALGLTELASASRSPGVSRQHNARIAGPESLDSYHEGDQTLSYRDPALLRWLANRMHRVVVNWPTWS